MAEEIPELVRIISGKGVIVIPDNFVEAHQIMLYSQIIRKPQTPSLNTTWNPDKTFYAHITFCIDDYVLFEYNVNFDNQCYDVFNGQEAQNLLSLICAYDGILDSFVNIGAVIGVVISRTNLITNHPYLRFKPNRLRFECFANSALKLTLKGTFLEKCRPEDGNPTPPPPPPPPTPQVPFDSPLVVSPPFDGVNDGGDTVPFPGDTPQTPGFPFGEPCVLYLVTAAFTSPDFPEPFEQTLTVSGRIFGVVVEPPLPGTSNVSYSVQGEELDPITGICDRPVFVSYISAPPGGQLEIVDIVEI